MEQNLVNVREIEENAFFQLEHKNQKVESLPEFRKCYERMNKYILEENNRRAHNYLTQPYAFEAPILLISFCNNCCSYTIFYFTFDYSTIKCLKCQSYYCSGCFKKCNSSDFSNCLKGYLKLLYLRIIYQRTGIDRFNQSYMWFLYLLHILFCLFFTPLYIGSISFMLGLIVHQNINRKENFWNE